MKTNWDKFYDEQMQNKQFAALVEDELAKLRIGSEIASMREEERLTQTALAARAGMPSSKISAIEAAPRNLTLETLIRIARAANRRLEIKFTSVRRKRR